MLRDTRLKTFLAFPLLGLLLLFSLQGFAQPVNEEDLPRGVMVSFRKNFPVIAVDGYLTHQGDYQLSFRADGADRVYLYTAEGKLLVMRIVMEEHSIPGEIRESVEGMAGFTLERAYKVKTASGNFYEVIVKDNNRSSLVRYNSDKERMSVTSLLPDGTLPRL